MFRALFVALQPAANRTRSSSAEGADHKTVAGEIRRRLREAGDAFAGSVHNRALRRAQLSFAAAWSAEWAFTVALSIVAFRDGGAAAVGLVSIVRLAPSAVVGPFVGTLADRFARDRIIAWSGYVRALAIAVAAGVLAAGGAPVLVYALATIATIAVTPLRAAHSALLPSLCRSPDELTGAMVTRGLLDSLSVLLGPLAVSVLLALGDTSAAFAAVAAASLWSALLVRGLSYEAAPRPASPAERPSPVAQIRAGLRAVRSADVALLASLFWAQTFTRGCLTVFSTVVAIDLLRLGDAGVGLLNGAVGAGAVLGSLGCTLLVSSRRLGRWLALSVALWGLPFALIGAFPSQGAALALLGVVGIANAILDVAFFSILGRLVPDELLGRVFGVIESGVALSVGIGALVTPLAIDLVGLRGALAVLGAVCPTVAVAAFMRLRSLDRTLGTYAAMIDVLRRAPMLQVLPATTIEELARHAERVSIEPDTAIRVQGEAGDGFYVVESGEVEV